MSARNEHELYADYAARGIKAATNRDEAMMLAGLLRGEPAYSDPRHPNHGLLKRDLAALYANHVPNQPEVTSVHIGGRQVVWGGHDPQTSNAPATPAAALIARWNRGDAAASFTAPERVQLRGLMVAHPAHNDPKHADHAAFVADAASLYAMDAPGGAE